jgi:hypothetical protein
MAPPKLQPALLGGLLAGVLSTLPYVNIANCCCLWLISGGVMAAYLMQLNHPLPITVGNGAVVGFLAGIAGALISLLLNIPMQAFVLSHLPQYGAFMGTPRHDMPPEVRETLRHISPRMITLISGVFFFIVALIFSTLGGLFGALVFRKAAPPSGPPPSPSHPPVIPPPGPPVESWSYPDQDQR